MTRPRILVTRRWPEAVERKLAEHFDPQLNPSDTPLTEADLRAAMGQFDAILPTVTDRLPEAVFSGPPPRTRILANFGVGYAHIDTAAAAAKGIVVSNTPDVLSECTADIAMTLMLMVARRANEGEAELREGRWTGWRPTHLIGTKVSGATLGIIGFGRIGQAMAQRAHFGFGMKILVQNRSKVAPEVLARYGAEQVDSIEALLPRCDFISLHCPGGAANHHLINAERLKLIRKDAFLINTARGEVIDEATLAEALQKGTIGGAGLDVFEREPQITAALLQTPNTVLLPHLGSATKTTREAMGFRVLDNLLDFFGDRPPRDRVA